MQSKVEPKLSIVIASFNSMPIIEKVLTAIHGQDLPGSEYEILVMDGGSKDSTIESAIKFGCRVINNPRTEPVYAKFLGINEARAPYICYLDHDEVLMDSRSLSRRLAVFSKYPEVRVLFGSGYVNPAGSPFSSAYINEFGDPFSFFIYRLSKHANFFVKSLRRKHRSEKTVEADLFPLTPEFNNDIIEIVAAGATFDRAFAFQRIPELDSNPSVIPHMFYRMLDSKSQMAILKDDPITHYSAIAWSAYVSKLRWRIINNVFNHKNLGESGFNGRNQFQGRLRRLKKILFMPYAFSLFLPLADALYLMATRRDRRYILHVPLTVYTAFEIAKQYCKKAFGLQSHLTSYDGKVRI